MYSVDNYAYEVLKAFTLTRNYTKWILNMIKPYLGNRILEVGCGIGNLTKELKNYGQLVGIDISSYFIQHIKINYPDLEFHKFDITDINVLSLKNKSFDTIVCVNVLEHIKDDCKALVNMFELLQPKGHLLLMVPAIQWAYGTMDIRVGHWRRYSKEELNDKLKQSGFYVERIFFYNLTGLFSWFVNSRILKRKQYPILQTMLFDKFLPLLVGVERIANLACRQTGLPK
ncbi:MAG: class I SAM-dependent methyltransferase [bacterium]|nr:class I SAM-dependent methyltransferase [bacterium]